MIVDLPAETEQPLFVPDRFDRLRERAGLKLQAIVTPVEGSLRSLDDRFADMTGADRGSLMILRGDSGAGKTTFLDTVHLFREDVVTVRIPFDASIAVELAKLEATTMNRIVVIEGRETLGTISAQVIEEGLHALNGFLRTDGGRSTLAVWPTNTRRIADELSDKAFALGGEALLGYGDRIEEFAGPTKEQYVQIAEQTIAALNEGASLAALGISEERATTLVEMCSTIGAFLGRVRNALTSNERRVRSLIARERCRVWTVVIAGNLPEGDVAALTRGGYSYADIDRLIVATGANIVAELKREPEQLGILSTVLDARIVHIDIVTALAIARTYGDPALHALMKDRGMQTRREPTKTSGRILSSELGLLLQDKPMGTRKRGSKPGSNTVDAFYNLTEISRTNDIVCNRAIGSALLANSLIESFDTEVDLGSGLTRRSDILCATVSHPIRLEIMWRTKAGRADIANYVLTKLANYGRAIGFLG